MSQTTCYRWTTDEAAIELQRLGLNRIALWKQRVLDFGIERTKTLLRDTSLTATSLGWTGGFTGSNGYTFEEALDDAWSTVELACELGAEVVHVATGGRNSHANGHLRRIVLEALDSLSGLANDCGVTLAVHPMASPYQDTWTFLNTISQALEIIDKLNHPSVKLGLNTYHVGQDPMLPKVLDERPECVAAFAVSDSDSKPRSENDACMIGRGVLGVSELIGRCRRGGYQGSIELDIWSEDLWSSPDYGNALAEAVEEFAAACLV